ncbi:MAG: glycosyltransferase family 2 protein [Deltaproteobacteria bacterium]|nr:MAG: glycosyltransferase family 2 protein [Deltaproteobacteria bacterium]
MDNLANMPEISIIIPCRNENNFIGKCLDSIIANDYPKDKLEILVVDGMSDDGTREIVSRYYEEYPFIRLLYNPEKFTPMAMNLGINCSKGEVIVMVNAHSVLDKDFLKYNIEYLDLTKSNAVGGMLNTINDEISLVMQAIPLAADSIFGSGGRRYRSRREEGFVTDTLPYCAYPRKTFEQYGYIDEELIRDQDEEFNYRILQRGGKIFFTPKIKSFLYVRRSLKMLWKQHFQYGYFKPLVTKKVGAILSWRQLIPAVFVSTFFISGMLSFMLRPFLWLFLLISLFYLATNLVFSITIGVNKGSQYIFILPIIFTMLHFSYGLGYLKGILDLIILKRQKKKIIEDIPLTR